MHLHFEFETSTTRDTPEDYVRYQLINAKCYDADFAEAYMLARLATTQVLWADALTDGVSLYEVCDGDSQELYDVYEILTLGEDDFRPELQVEENTSHVMFLRAAVFHPVVHRYRKAILDTAFKVLGVDSVAVMWEETSGLSMAQLSQLGFKKVSRQPLVYRHSASLTPFRMRYPQGQEADVTASPEHEAWVNEAWEKKITGTAGEVVDETHQPTGRPDVAEDESLQPLTDESGDLPPR